MLLVGVVDIVLGAVGALFSCAWVLVVVAWRFPHLLGPVHPPFGNFPDIEFAPAEDLPAINRTFALVLAFGIGQAVASVFFVLAGLRVLDVAPAGRRLSLVAIYLWTFIALAELIVMPWWWFLMLAAYPALVEVLFQTRRWKEAFSGDLTGGGEGRPAT
jgi:hypothetical protein